MSPPPKKNKIGSQTSYAPRPHSISQLSIASKLSQAFEVDDSDQKACH